MNALLKNSDQIRFCILRESREFDPWNHIRPAYVPLSGIMNGSLYPHVIVWEKPSHSLKSFFGLDLFTQEPKLLQQPQLGFRWKNCFGQRFDLDFEIQVTVLAVECSQQNGKSTMIGSPLACLPRTMQKDLKAKAQVQDSKAFTVE